MGGRTWINGQLVDLGPPTNPENASVLTPQLARHMSSQLQALHELETPVTLSHNDRVRFGMCVCVLHELKKSVTLSHNDDVSFGNRHRWFFGQT